VIYKTKGECEMVKYKVGDTVKVIKNVYGTHLLGKDVTIKQLDTSPFTAFPYYVVDEDGFTDDWLAEEEIELVKSVDETNIEEEAAMTTGRKFKVGDLVKGNKLSDERYGVTTSEMTLGEVISVNNLDFKDSFSVKILKHEDEKWIGEKFTDLESQLFDLVDAPVKVEEKEKEKPAKNNVTGALKVKIEAEVVPVVKKSKSKAPKIKVKTVGQLTFITIDSKITICTTDDKVGISIKDNIDEYNEEVGNGLAMYRKFVKETE
jgi:hypothetical protein